MHIMEEIKIFGNLRQGISSSLTIVHWYSGHHMSKHLMRYQQWNQSTYMAISDVSRESITRLQFYSDLDDMSTSSPLLLSDNQSALVLTGDPQILSGPSTLIFVIILSGMQLPKVKLSLIIFLRRINRRTFSPKLSVLNFINCM
jgi:hypothetical protein